MKREILICLLIILVLFSGCPDDEGNGRNRYPPIDECSTENYATYKDRSNDNILDSKSRAALVEALKNQDTAALQEFSKLTCLTKLELQTSSISGLPNLPNLKIIYITNSDLSDISALSQYTGLRQLDLSDNKIQDISPLANLNNLEYLYLSNNNISESDCGHLKEQLPNTKVVC